LVFCEAFRLDTNLANRVFWQCLFLAGHGAVLTAFAAAGVFFFVFPHHWDLATCVMAGAILSSTDAGSIVETLEELGAAPVLIMRIRGESMLSDGTVLVLFNIAYRMVGGEDCEPGVVAVDIVKSFFGAFAVGGLVGVVFLKWMRSASDRLMRKNSWIQILLTLTCAYLSYILAEGLCHMSGVISTVAAGSVLARHAWPAVVEKQAMLEFWHIVELICKILVFFLAGMITGQSAGQHAATEYLWVLATYVAMNVIRLVMLLGLWCPMNVVGQRLRVRDIVALWAGGMRGIVALCLAILVNEDRGDGKLEPSISSKILFHVAGVVTLTLVVNATTAPLLFSFFGITQRGEGRKALVRHVARRARVHVNKSLHDSIAAGQLPRSCHLSIVLKDVHDLGVAVKAAANADKDDRSQGEGAEAVESGHRRRLELAEPDVRKLWKTFREHKVSALQCGEKLRSFKLGAQLADIRRLLGEQNISARHLSIVREVFLEAVRASYWEQVEEGRFALSTAHMRVLVDSIDMAKGKCGKRLADWSVLKEDIRLSPAPGAAQSSGIGARLARWCDEFRAWVKGLSSEVEALQLIEAFIRAHERAQVEIAAYFGQDASIDSGEEAYVILESQISIFAATILHASVASPVQRHISTTQESYRLFTLCRNYILAAHERGVLRGAEAEQLMEPVAEAMRHLSARLAHRPLEGQKLRGGVAAMHEVEAAVIVQRAYRRWRMLRHVSVTRLASASSRRS